MKIVLSNPNTLLWDGAQAQPEGSPFPETAAGLPGMAATDATAAVADIPEHTRPGGWWPALLATAIGASLITLLLIGLCRRRRKQRCGVSPASKRARPDEISLAVGNVHGLGKRGNQEDAFGVSDIGNAALCKERGVLAVVADGMGGLQRGEEVSGAATAAMLERFPTVPTAWTPAQQLLYLMYQAAGEADARVADSATGPCGSTMVAALLQGDRLSFVSIGDSRISLYRGGGLIHLNCAHTLAAESDRRAAEGGFPFDGPEDEPRRRALTSYIGMGVLKEVDFNTEPIRVLPGDRLLLMTDGVFGTVTDAELAEAMRMDAQQAAESVERIILNKNSSIQDNYTLIVLQISASGRKKI